MTHLEDRISKRLRDAADRIEVHRDVGAVVDRVQLTPPIPNDARGRLLALAGVAAVVVVIAAAGLVAIARRDASRTSEVTTSVIPEPPTSIGRPVVATPPEWVDGDLNPATIGPISNQPAAYAVLANLDAGADVADEPVLLIVDGMGSSCDPNESRVETTDGSVFCVIEGDEMNYVRALVSPGGRAIGDASVSRLSNIAVSVTWNDLGEEQPFSYGSPGRYSIRTDAVLIPPVERPGLISNGPSERIEIVNVSDFRDPLIALVATRPGRPVTQVDVAGAHGWCNDGGLAWSPRSGAVIAITIGADNTATCDQLVELAEATTLQE